MSTAGRRSIIGKKIKKLVKKVAKPLLMPVDDVLNSAGLPSLMGKDTGILNASEREKKLAKAADAEQRRLEANSLQAARDADADLSSGYFTDVRSGSSRKRKGISTSLGL